MLSASIIIFQSDGSQVLNKEFIDCKAGKSIEEDLYSKVAENKSIITNSLK